jgi:hypothetical protein
MGAACLGSIEKDSVEMEVLGLKGPLLMSMVLSNFKLKGVPGRYAREGIFLRIECPGQKQHETPAKNDMVARWPNKELCRFALKKTEK